MNDHDNRPQNDTAPDTAQPDTAAAAPKASTSLDRELADMKDRLLRTLADMENMRKRTDREVADARVYGISSFARDILGVADNMHRAMQALDDELRATFRLHTPWGSADVALLARGEHQVPNALAAAAAGGGLGVDDAHAPTSAQLS